MIVILHYDTLLFYITPHHSKLRTQNSELKKMSKKEIIQKIIHLLATILTAIATTLGTTSCIGLMQ